MARRALSGYPDKAGEKTIIQKLLSQSNTGTLMTTQETAYTEIERLVESFKDISTVWCEDDLDRVRNLECDIVRVDEEIDKRVSVHYGLTEEEIKIVES